MGEKKHKEARDAGNNQVGDARDTGNNPRGEITLKDRLEQVDLSAGLGDRARRASCVLYLFLFAGS